MSQTLVAPLQDQTIEGSGRWMVVIYNNELNTFEEVIGVLMRATGCGYDEAAIEAWEAHTYGKAPVHFSTKTECRRTAETISSIGVQTEVLPEWND
jgi:hypothetical protein